MDDIIVFGEDHAQHDAALKIVLQRIRDNNLKLNKDKCQFGVPRLVFLGDLITEDGIKPDPKKISAIQNMPPPTDKAGVQRFMGMINYQAKWIPELAKKSEPLRSCCKRTQSSLGNMSILQHLMN